MNQARGLQLLTFFERIQQLSHGYTGGSSVTLCGHRILTKFQNSFSDSCGLVASQAKPDTHARFCFHQWLQVDQHKTMAALAHLGRTFLLVLPEVPCVRATQMYLSRSRQTSSSAWQCQGSIGKLCETGHK
ncbi:hypothetical protein OIU78_029393 [Salix suchowensis]|nr:hypothetical protein OIU78_029393 [Salix suchowensis]